MTNEINETTNESQVLSTINPTSYVQRYTKGKRHVGLGTHAGACHIHGTGLMAGPFSADISSDPFGEMFS
jgi:hypothetical protein